MGFAGSHGSEMPMLVANVNCRMIRKFLCPCPRSAIYTGYSLGSFFACLMSADTTVWVSLLATFASIT